MIWVIRAFGGLTLLYGLSALAKPGVIARHGELADPTDRRSGVHLLSATVGIRDAVSGLAIMLAPTGLGLIAALGLRAAFDLGDAAAFGLLLPTVRARRKLAAIAFVWGAIAAVLMLGAG